MMWYSTLVLYGAHHFYFIFKKFFFFFMETIVCLTTMLCPSFLVNLNRVGLSLRDLGLNNNRVSLS